MKRIVLVTLILQSGVVLADSGFSVEALVGQSDQTLDLGGRNLVSDNPVSLGIRTGYSFNEYVAVELSYIDFGEASNSSQDSDVRAQSRMFFLGVKGSVPLSEKFNLNGRIGVGRKGGEWVIQDNGETLRQEDLSAPKYIGVGLSYEISPQYFAGVEYSIVEQDAKLGGVNAEYEIDSVMLSVGYRF